MPYMHMYTIGSDLTLENNHIGALSHRSLRWFLPNIRTLVDPLCDTKRPNAAVHSILQSHEKEKFLDMHVSNPFATYVYFLRSNES